VDNLWISKGLEEECSRQGPRSSNKGWGESTGSCAGAGQSTVVVQLG